MIQTQVLNKILKTGDLSFITVNNFSADYFSDYPAEYHFILDHYNTYGKVPDKETFISKFPNFDFIEVTEPDSFLADELYGDKFFRDLVGTVSSLKADVSQKDVTKAKQKILDLVNGFSSGIGLKAVDLFSDTSRYDEYVERTKDFGHYFIKTGFPELDELIGGWDRHEEYATIFARTGNGKSWVLDKVCVAAAAQGLNVGLYSGEMSATKVGYRIDTIISGISNYGISKGRVNVQNDYKNYIEGLKTEFKGHIWVATPNDFGGAVTVSALRAFIEKYRLDILFIDQHSLIDDEHNARIAHEKAANISKDIKKLQVLKGIPIITAAQQNREKTDEGISTAHIALSDRIAQDSTIILALETKDDVLTMHITKCRDAGTGKKLRYNVDFDSGNFQYIPDSENVEDLPKIQALKDEFKDSAPNIPWG